MMNVSKFLLAAGVYFLVSFAIGYVWHLLFFKNFYDGFALFGQSTVNPQMSMLALGTAIEAAAFAFLYLQFVKDTRRVGFGMLLGVCLFLFASSYGIFQLAATADIKGSGRLVFIGLELSYMLLAGLACGGLTSLAVKNGKS